MTRFAKKFHVDSKLSQRNDSLIRENRWLKMELTISTSGKRVLERQNTALILQVNQLIRERDDALRRIHSGRNSPMSTSSRSTKSTKSERKGRKRTDKVSEKRSNGESVTSSCGTEPTWTCPGCFHHVSQWDSIQAAIPCGHATCGSCISKLSPGKPDAFCQQCKAPVSGRIGIYFN